MSSVRSACHSPGMHRGALQCACAGVWLGTSSWGSSSRRRHMYWVSPLGGWEAQQCCLAPSLLAGGILLVSSQGGVSGVFLIHNESLGLLPAHLRVYLAQLSETLSCQAPCEGLSSFWLSTPLPGGMKRGPSHDSLLARGERKPQGLELQ